MAILDSVPGIRFEVWVAGLALNDYGTHGDDQDHRIQPRQRVRRIVPVREEHYVPAVIFEPRFHIPPAYVANDDKIKVEIYVDGASKPDATCTVKVSEIEAWRARNTPLVCPMPTIRLCSKSYPTKVAYAKRKFVALDAGEFLVSPRWLQAHKCLKISHPFAEISARVIQLDS